MSLYFVFSQIFDQEKRGLCFWLREFGILSNCHDFFYECSLFLDQDSTWKLEDYLTWNFQKNMEFCMNFRIVSWCYPALLYLSYDLFRYAWWKRGAVWNHPKGKKPLPETSISVHQMSGDSIYQVFISTQYAQHHSRVSSKMGPLCWMATGRTWKGNWLILFVSIR